MFRTFKARAVNANRDSFQFNFKHVNWCGIEAAAQSELDRLVAASETHKKYGPWKIENIDVTAG